MSIFDYAMQMEKEGEALYREFAEAAPEKGMAVIFTQLAEQEREHYEVFKKMEGNQDVEIAQTSFVNNVKGIFAEWKSHKDKFNFKISQAGLYRKALDIEQKSIDFYFEKSKEVKDVKQKEIFLKIADEERRHYAIIENIIEFMIKPERWVEHAMFTKAGEEY